MPLPRGLLLNATGKELPKDMVSIATIEPYKLSVDAEEYYYEELNSLPVTERVNRFVEMIEKNRQIIGAIIVEHNELGVALFERLSSQESFIASFKTLSENKHSYYVNIDRMKPIDSGEWLKDALEVGSNGLADRDFFNIWTQPPAPNQFIPMAKTEIGDHIQERQCPVASMNANQLPTDEDMAALAKLGPVGEGILKIESVGLDPMEALKQESQQLRLEQAYRSGLSKGSLLSASKDRVIAAYRRGTGATANDLFEKIKHGDEKHQAWLKAALESFFNGVEPMNEEEFQVYLKSVEAFNEKHEADLKAAVFGQL